MELVAKGAQDIYLTGNPNVTYFKSIFKRHTNFSMESIQQSFSGDLNFGKRINSSFLCGPVKVINPIRAKSFEVIKISTIIPSSIIGHFMPRKICNTEHYISKVVFRNYKLERMYIWISFNTVSQVVNSLVLVFSKEVIKPK